MLSSGDATTIGTVAAQFNVCWSTDLTDVKNQRLFAGDGVVTIPGQSNDPACSTPLCSIAKICGELTAEPTSNETDLARLARVADLQNGGECVNANWEESLAFLSSEAAILSGAKSWLYVSDDDQKP